MMQSAWMYYGCASLLIVGNCIAWVATLLTLPGNWLIVFFSIVFTLIYPEQDGRGMSWVVVGVLIGLAVLGEILEFATGAVVSAQQGASRRAIVLSIVGAIAGSVIGAAVGFPIPIFGPIIGALGGGCVGAFAGAYGGEVWKGRDSVESMASGKSAMVGRLLGTVAKVAIGAVMVVVAAIDVFF